MKLSLMIGALLVSLAAWATYEDSFLYKEFLRRSQETPDLFSKKVVKALQKAGVKTFEIQAITSDQATGDFSFENLREELCKGNMVNDVATFSCAPKWSPWEQALIQEIYEKIPKEEIVQFEAYETSGKFVFETVRHEICHGDFIIGKASYFCYSKAGIMTFFAGGDGD